MKLVNVEDLKVLVAVESEGSIRYGKLVTDLFDDIPTVEAIPIEYIQKWNNNYIADTMRNGRTIINQMLKDWEKENENN